MILSCKTKQKITDKIDMGVLKMSEFHNIKIDEIEAYKVGTAEPSITYNPINPKQLIAGSVLNNVYTSNDGGLTWTKSRLSSSQGVYGDPCLINDNKGHIYYLHLSNPEGKGHGSTSFLNQIVIQRSDDVGKTWTDGTSIGKNEPKQQDKEWAITHPETGEIYVTWTEFDKYGSDDPNHKSRIRFSKSSDFGNTFSEAITISELEGTALDGDTTTEGAVPAVDKDGNIYVAWSLNKKIYFDKSTDGGMTWQDKDQIIATQPGGWDQSFSGTERCNGMPVTVVDNSNTNHNGTIYVNWTDERNGSDNIDVFLIKSIDKGKTWSEPIKVNQDTTQTHQYFTWMTIDPITGYLYFVYFDRSRYADNQTDVVLTVSKDAGETFQSYIISESPFTPRKGVFLGDYNNIIAYDGMVRPIWTRLDGNKKSVWTALIDANKL